MTIEGKSLCPDTNGALVQASAAKFKAKFVCCFRFVGQFDKAAASPLWSSFLPGCLGCEKRKYGCVAVEKNTGREGLGMSAAI